MCSTINTSLDDLNSTINTSLDDLVTFYNDDICNTSLLTTELWRWRAKWEEQDASNHPSTLESALKCCDPDSL